MPQKYPALHTDVGSSRAVVPQYMPGVHCWHSDIEPSFDLLLYVPFGHANSDPYSVMDGQ